MQISNSNKKAGKMKRNLIIAALVLGFSSLAHAQFLNGPIARAGYCLSITGSYLPIATPANAAGTGVPTQPTAFTVYGLNGSSYYPLLCDASGNLVAGDFPTGATLPATCTSAPMQVYGLVTAGTTAPYYCSTANTWTAFGSGGGGGSNPVGGLYAIQTYATSSTLGGSANATVDGSGNLYAAGKGSFGAAGTGTNLGFTAIPIANLPAASTLPPVTTGSNTQYTFLYVLDGTSSSDCSTGGGTNLHWCYSNGSTWITSVPAGSGTVTTVSVATANGFSGTVANATTTPTITIVAGAITPSSLAATGIVDGKAPVTVTTGSSATLGGTYSSGYTYNENATAATAITYTLPTAAAGKQYCVANAYNGSAANTGTLELLTSASGQFIIYTDGSLSATGGYVISGGAARDAACVVGVDATHWLLYVNSGTWTKH